MSVPVEIMRTTLSLEHLLRDYANAPDIPISSIASDSRQVSEDCLFLACEGATSHGLDYVDEAVKAGAVAVAWDASTAAKPRNIGIPMIGVENLRMYLGEIANRFYGYPSSRLDVVGVTGTNGKTTVAWMIAQCLQRLEMRCGYVGTLGCGIDELHGSGGMTTPATLELHECLANFVDRGATHAALEVSSHALSQQRVDGIRFDAVLFTNLSRDHLDYHGSMSEYFETKAQLFLDTGAGIKIVNIDSQYGAELAGRCGQDVLIVSSDVDRIADGRPFVFVTSVALSERGSGITFATSWGEASLTLPLAGEFNVANAATVLAYLLSHGIVLEHACDALGQSAAPPGRLQRVVADNRSVYVDYAHTPDAIESALRGLRPHCRGALWCVFGCGGDRDAGKRPQMAALAERYADRLVVTSDNPRSEAPNKIIDEIIAGLQDADTATVIEDRAAAIGWAIANAEPLDVVLVAGKGHENYQQIGNDRLPFSDYNIAFSALKKKEGRA